MYASGLQMQALPSRLGARSKPLHRHLVRPNHFLLAPPVAASSSPPQLKPLTEEFKQPLTLLEGDSEAQTAQSQPTDSGAATSRSAVRERRQQRLREQQFYKLIAVAASLGVTGLAILATYLRFYWHLRDAGEMPWAELASTVALVAGGVFFMEMWARYAHKSLWHDLPSGWALHKSHHEPRTGPFEANDIFAIINGVPAMGLCAYGFLTPNLTGGLCFGAGLGITLFGIMYMFVHDGLVHRRFPVGPIAELPALKRIAVAHQMHHGGKFDGAPWGLFLAVQELDAIPGARAELERLVQQAEQKEQEQTQGAGEQ